MAFHGPGRAVGEDGVHQAAVKVVSCPPGYDATSEPTPEKGQIADQIQELVPYEFVWKAQPAALESVVIDKNGVVQGPSFDQPRALEMFHVPPESEGPGRGQLREEILHIIEPYGEILITEMFVLEIDSGCDLKTFTRVNLDQPVIVSHEDRACDDELSLLLLLLPHAGIQQGVGEGEGGSIQDRDFAAAQVEPGIVDAEAEESGEKMLRRVDGRASAHEARSVDHRSAVLLEGRNLGTAQVVTNKNQPAGGWRRANSQPDRLATVETDALEFQFSPDRSLGTHRCILYRHEARSSRAKELKMSSGDPSGERQTYQGAAVDLLGRLPKND